MSVVSESASQVTPLPDLLKRVTTTLEAGRVMRYHAAPTVQAQSVGEHTFGGIIILLYLTDGNASAALLTRFALHDAPEIVTGDCPFDVKRNNPKVKQMYDQMEQQAFMEHLLSPREDCTKHEMALMKMADTLDGLIWCYKTEHGSFIYDRWVQSANNCVDKFMSVVSEIQMARFIALTDHYSHG